MIIGIDPGKSGGIAAYEPSTKTLLVGNTPATDKGKFNVVKELVQLSGNSGQLVGYIEKLTGAQGGRKDDDGNFIRRSNPRSSYVLGQEVKACQMALSMNDVPYIEVIPARWQREVGASVGGIQFVKTPAKYKSHLKQIAENLFPTVKVTLKNADALLIMLYGAREVLNLKVLPIQEVVVLKDY